MAKKPATATEKKSTKKDAEKIPSRRAVKTAVAAATAKLREKDVKIPNTTEETVLVADLRKHPRNYKSHPPDQLSHIADSLKANGFYKNVVISKDGTILAGHGVVEAAQTIGLKKIPVRRMPYGPEDPRAIKIVIGDNELGLLAERDDRMLTELLKDIKDKDVSLLGTGFDEKMFAALVMVSRPASEIRDMNEAAEWVGMPDYKDGETQIKLVITFKSEEDRKAYCKKTGAKIDKIAGLTWSTRWPWTDREDASSVRFATKPPEEGTDANGRTDTPDAKKLSSKKKDAAAPKDAAAE